MKPKEFCIVTSVLTLCRIIILIVENVEASIGIRQSVMSQILAVSQKSIMLAGNVGWG